MGPAKRGSCRRCGVDQGQIFAWRGKDAGTGRATRAALPWRGSRATRGQVQGNVAARQRLTFGPHWVPKASARLSCIVRGMGHPMFASVAMSALRAMIQGQDPRQPVMNWLSTQRGPHPPTSALWTTHPPEQCSSKYQAPEGGKDPEYEPYVTIVGCRRLEPLSRRYEYKHRAHDSDGYSREHLPPLARSRDHIARPFIIRPHYHHHPQLNSAPDGEGPRANMK